MADMITMTNATLNATREFPATSQSYWESRGWVRVGGNPAPVYDPALDTYFGSLLSNPASATGAAGRAASVSANALALAANPDTLIAGAITRDANGAATAAPVVWPDGATGAYAATTVSTSFPGAVDAYTITRVKDGATTTFTQSAVTRDAGGAVTQRPALTVAVS